MVADILQRIIRDQAVRLHGSGQRATPERNPLRSGVAMHYKLLGTTGVKVSTLCFGTMSFGGDADAATAAAMFHRCREVGINFFDCADVYAGGRSAEILGELG